MKRIILATVFSLIASPAFSQKVVPWELLAVPYSTTPDGLYSPQFPSYLDAYELQEVVLQGYLVPVDVEGHFPVVFFAEMPNQIPLSNYSSRNALMR